MRYCASVPASALSDPSRVAPALGAAGACASAGRGATAGWGGGATAAGGATGCGAMGGAAITGAEGEGVGAISTGRGTSGRAGCRGSGRGGVTGAGSAGNGDNGALRGDNTALSICTGAAALLPSRMPGSRNSIAACSASDASTQPIRARFCVRASNKGLKAGKGNACMGCLWYRHRAVSRIPGFGQTSGAPFACFPENTFLQMHISATRKNK